ENDCLTSAPAEGVAKAASRRRSRWREADARSRGENCQSSCVVTSLHPTPPPSAATLPLQGRVTCGTIPANPRHACLRQYLNLAHQVSKLPHQVLVVLDAEQGGAEIAADRLVLVGDVLPSGRDVGEDAAERQVRIERGAACGLEQARRQHAAAFPDQRRMVLVFDPLAQRRPLAALPPGTPGSPGAGQD